MALVALDTDIGTDADDATALLLLLNAREVELAGVAVVSGRTGVRAALARRLLELAGRQVPVFAGFGRPLTGARFSPWLPDGLWMGHEGKGVLSDAEIEAADSSADPGTAIDAFAEVIAVNQKVTLITIGPLTNVALALARSPEFSRAIDSHFAMGGVVVGEIVVGNASLPSIFEYNLNADREATLRTFEARLPTTLIPAEFTYRVWLAPADVEALRARGDAAVRGVCSLIDVWTPIYHELVRGFGIPTSAFAPIASHLHDSVTVMAALDPDLFLLEELHIDLVERSGVLETIANPAGAFAVRVAVGGDIPRIRRRIIEMLLSNGARASCATSNSACTPSAGGRRQRSPAEPSGA